MPRAGLTARQREITRRIASDLGRITSPFVDELSRRAASLSPVEVRICNLIRQGLAVKEVSRIEQVSPSTVSTHRRSIRRGRTHGRCGGAEPPTG